MKVYDNGGKTADRYTVVFSDGSMYAMSRDANMPNGVCMYIGNEKFTYVYPDALGKRINAKNLPEGTKKQIEYLKNTYEDLK